MMVRNLQKHRSGFTIIELLIYLGIFSIVIMAVGIIVFQTITNKIQSETIQEVGYHAQMIMDKITTSVAGAVSVASPVSGQTGTSVSLVVADPTKTPTVWYVSSGTLYVQEGADQPVAVSSDLVTITDVSFVNVAPVGVPGSIRVTMTIASSNTSGRSEYQYVETFYTTVTIRQQ